MRSSPPTWSAPPRRPVDRSPISSASSFDSTSHSSPRLTEIRYSGLWAKGLSRRDQSTTSSTVSASPTADGQPPEHGHDLCRYVFLDRDVQPPGRSTLTRGGARAPAFRGPVRSYEPCSWGNVDLSRPADVASGCRRVPRWSRTISSHEDRIRVAGP